MLLDIYVRQDMLFIFSQCAGTSRQRMRCNIVTALREHRPSPRPIRTGFGVQVRSRIMSKI